MGWSKSSERWRDILEETKERRGGPRLKPRRQEITRESEK